jgi:hypothetical protein
VDEDAVAVDEGHLPAVAPLANTSRQPSHRRRVYSRGPDAEQAGSIGT